MKVGDYVRTNDGFIARIKKIEQNERLHLFLKAIYTDNYKIDMVLEDEIIKSSPNIIDLIQVGDMVNYEQLNGGIVLNKKEDSIDTWSILFNSLKNEDIKSVITKEQLKNCMYEIGE